MAATAMVNNIADALAACDDLQESGDLLDRETVERLLGTIRRVLRQNNLALGVTLGMLTAAKENKTISVVGTLLLRALSDGAEMDSMVREVESIIAEKPVPGPTVWKDDPREGGAL